jgi:hypothetical protein
MPIDKESWIRVASASRDSQSSSAIRLKDIAPPQSAMQVCLGTAGVIDWTLRNSCTGSSPISWMLKRPLPPAMITGVETAGLVLAVLPLLIAALEDYKRGLKPI